MLGLGASRDIVIYVVMLASLLDLFFRSSFISDSENRRSMGTTSDAAAKTNEHVEDSKEIR